MKYASLLCFCACGAPFESAHHVPAEGGLEGSHPDGTAPEAGKDAHGEATPPVDAPPPTDAGHDVVPPPFDAAHDAPAPPVDSGHDTGCTPFGTAMVTCPDLTPISTTPTNYCVYDSTSGVSTLATTPAECQCKSTYSCACLEGSVTVPGQLCKATQVYAGCTVVGGAPLVTCEDP
jgi:hypothetical protein